MLAQPIIALIRHDDACLLRVDGRVGEVGRVTERALGDGLEQSRLANVGETDLQS